MSKEVENKTKNNVNIGRELLRKQLFDCSIIFITLSVIFYFVCVQRYEKFDLMIVLVISFLVDVALFEFSRRAVKGPLNMLVEDVYVNTLEDIAQIQSKNVSQKENSILSEAKIKNIEEIVENLQKYSTDMKEVTDKAQEKTNESINFTNDEYSAVKSNIEKMFSIRHKIQTIAELILELSDFVQSISSTIGLVEDIAEQTNLLALNAAVEAARAGEHGKGFAVVASEIRKLADESKQATTKIISLINDIQQTANSTVLATEEGTKEIESGLELAHKISENIEFLINAMNEISSNMQEIIISSKQINTDSKTTNIYLKEVSKMVENSKEYITANDNAIKKIEITSQEFKNSVI
ncbi:MAG: hypothetical protein IKR34_01230 [Candidatus Gastranaerophilales bacterium]|nr:hypothetical protein [Candidatus Gastranaerophilales bacterium]